MAWLVGKNEGIAAVHGTARQGSRMGTLSIEPQEEIQLERGASELLIVTPFSQHISKPFSKFSYSPKNNSD
jgi:hypothetical protein